MRCPRYCSYVMLQTSNKKDVVKCSLNSIALLHLMAKSTPPLTANDSLTSTSQCGYVSGSAKHWSSRVSTIYAAEELSTTYTFTDQRQH